MKVLSPSSCYLSRPVRPRKIARAQNATGNRIRTFGLPPELVVDLSGSRRNHRAKYGCLSARPRVRCLCPPGKTQHLLPKSVFDRPGSDRWNLASTTFPDAGPMVRIRFPPSRILSHQCLPWLEAQRPGFCRECEPGRDQRTGRAGPEPARLGCFSLTGIDAVPPREITALNEKSPAWAWAHS